MSGQTSAAADAQAGGNALGRTEPAGPCEVPADALSRPPVQHANEDAPAVLRGPGAVTLRPAGTGSAGSSPPTSRSPTSGDRSSGVVVACAGGAGVLSAVWAGSAAASKLPSGTALVVLVVAAALIAFGEVRSVSMPTSTMFGSRSGAWVMSSAAVAGVLVAVHSAGVFAVGAGIACASLYMRRPPSKIVFNVGQHTTAAAAAAWVLTTFAASTGFDPTDWRSAAAAVTAAAVYELGTLTAVAVAIAVTSGRKLRAVLWRTLTVSSVGSMSNAALGAAAGLLWHVAPPATLLVAVPMLMADRVYNAMALLAAATEQMKREHARLMQTVEGIDDGIVVFDSEGRLALVSQVAADLAARPADEMVELDGSGWWTASTSEDTCDLAEMVAATSVQEPRLASHVQLGPTSLPARPPLPVRVEVHASFERDGRRGDSVVVLHDRSSDLSLATLKDEFLARVSHDLRSPLAPIITYSELLRSSRNRLSDEQLDRACETMAGKSKQLTRMVDDLLLVSRISAGHASLAGQLQMRPVTVSKTVDECVSDAQLAYPEQPFRVTTSDPGMRIVADEGRLAQVVTNLLSNACKYAPEEPIMVDVRADVREAFVAVTDRGPGIAPDEIEGLFERFARSADATAGAGSGVGLFIVHTLTEAMGGKVEASSTLGGGTTFTVSFPLAST